MSSPIHTKTTLAATLAGALRDGSLMLAKHWCERVLDRVDGHRTQVLSDTARREDVPSMIRAIADYVENPLNEIAADSSAIAKAMELGASRYREQFDVYELLKEYELLGGILYSYLAQACPVDQCESGALLLCGQRLFRAIALIEQATVMHFLRLTEERRSQREEQQRSFNRALSHEIKNQIGVVLGASEAMLTIPAGEWAEHANLLDIIARNARTIQHTMENLTSLSRAHNDARQQHHLRLAVAAREAARQLRENFRDAQVDISVEQMPDVEVNAAAVELCVTNYLSNAIKYADPGKRHRYVVVSGSVESAPGGGREVVVRVRDNGLGVPLDKRRSLFKRFFRANDPAAAPVEGTGLGLSIVSETVASLGGRAWAEFPGSGSVFAFSLPYRRAHTGDAA